MDAVEIFEPYVDKYKLRKKYDNVYINSIVVFDIKDYDFIILGDVLEHLPENYAKELINDIVNLVKNVWLLYHMKWNKENMRVTFMRLTTNQT